tara:strand:- start:1805 stop:1924 length:120 start_codon:yes stop_codon:yes gene_type:complete
MTAYEVGQRVQVSIRAPVKGRQQHVDQNKADLKFRSAPL